MTCPSEPLARASHPACPDEARRDYLARWLVTWEAALLEMDPASPDRIKGTATWQERLAEYEQLETATNRRNGC